MNFEDVRLQQVWTFRRLAEVELQVAASFDRLAATGDPRHRQRRLELAADARAEAERARRIADRYATKPSGADGDPAG